MITTTTTTTTKKNKPKQNQMLEQFLGQVDLGCAWFPEVGMVNIQMTWGRKRKRERIGFRKAVVTCLGLVSKRERKRISEVS